MRRAPATVLALLAWAASAGARAQPPAHEGGPSAAGAMPAGHPPIGPGARAGRDPFDAPPVATAEPSDELAAGTIRVRVVDADGRPIERATVVLGTMSQGGERHRVSALTDVDGRHAWTGLATGTGLAYRVSVPHEGATYACSPFQLPPDRGYDVRIVRLPITHDDRTVLQVIGQTFVEFRDERLHVIQQAQLANMSPVPRTYVFPEGGLRVRLPEGYLAFQAQPSMSDQRVEEIAGRGLRIRGSLPPGRVTLTWAFDLPISGADMDVRLNNPFRTYIYRVITDAPEGMRLEVEGLPPVQAFEDQGRRLLGTEVTRRPGEAPLSALTLRFRGIPGPGPARWIALLAACAMVAAGVVAALRRGSSAQTLRQSRERRKAELLAEAARLEDEFARGEIGPTYRQTRRAAIVREIALLLYEEKLHEAEPEPNAVSGSRGVPRSAAVPARTME